MFSGIVETIGTILQIQTINGCKQLHIKPQMQFDDLQIGDSISINGVCLTITQFDINQFIATVVPETLRITNLGLLVQGDTVNVERSLKVNARNSGHFVQGHVDGTGEIIHIQEDNSNALLVKIKANPTLTKYIVKKGYVALDGMSITIIDVCTDWFTVTLIPHTQNATISHQYRKGSIINIEVDILGKYIEKLLGATSYANLN